MRRHISTGLVVAACALAGCGGDDNGGGGDSGDSAGNGYPKVAETNFVKACSDQPGTTTAKCQCAFDKIKQKVPFDEFKKADEALRAGKSADPSTQRKLQDAVRECA